MNRFRSLLLVVLAGLLAVLFSASVLGDKITGPLIRNYSGDGYATHYSHTGYGGYANITNISDLTSLQLAPGMVVSLTSSNNWFMRTFDNASWIPLYMMTNDVQGFLGNWTNLVAPKASPTFTGTVTLPSSGVKFNDGSVQTTAASGSPYRLTQSGTNVTLTASSIRWEDGQISTVSSQSVGLWVEAGRSSYTNFIGIDLYTLGLVNYPRRLDQGTKWIASIVTDSTGTNITALNYLSGSQDAPASRLQGVKNLMSLGNVPMLFVAIGDSISGPYPNYTTNWFQGLFTQSSWSPDYISHSATWVANNYAVGTQTPFMGLASVGRSIPLNNSASSSGNLAMTQPLNAEIALRGNHGMSPAVEANPNVAFVGYYNYPLINNNDRFPLIERIVQTFRLRGIPVILHCDEPGLGSAGTNYWDHFVDGPQLAAIADQHGATFIDTQSRCIFTVTMGGSSPAAFFADAGSNALHPNDTGHLYWVKWMRAALNGNIQRREEVPGQWQMTSLPSNASQQIAFPFAFEFQPPAAAGSPAPTQVANPYTTISSFNSANPAQYIGQVANSTGGWSGSTGSSYLFYHPLALSFNLLVDGSQSFGWTVFIGGTSIKSGNFSSVNSRPAIAELMTVADMRGIAASGNYNHGKPDFAENISMAVTITSGTPVIFGAEWGVPQYYDVPINSLNYIGTGWDATDKVGDANSYYYIRGTDTSGDMVKFSFRGAGAQLMLQSGTAAGQIQAWLDGTQITTLNGVSWSTYDQYIGATRGLQLNVMPNSPRTGDINSWGHRIHTLTVKYTGGLNGNATNNLSSTKRRLAVMGARVIGDTTTR